LKPPLDRSCGGRKGVVSETRRLRGDFHCMRP
jgi:hypothetical protein